MRWKMGVLRGPVRRRRGRSWTSTALGTPTFLETVRSLVDEEAPAAAPTGEDARTKLAAAGVQFLEALAAVIAAENICDPPELASRGTAALRTIMQAWISATPTARTTPGHSSRTR